MKLLLLVLLAAPLWASNSLSLIGNTQIYSAATDNTAWASVTDYRMEILVTDYTTAGGNWTVGGLGGGVGAVILTTTGAVGFRPINGATDCILGNLNGATNFRILAQRITASALYALEIWNEDNGDYSLTTCTDTSPTAANLSASTIYAGVDSGTQQTLKLGALRFYSTNVATGGAPPQRYRTNGYGDRGDWEFESALTDASGLGQTMSVSTGSSAYVATPTYDPVLVSDAIARSVRSGTSTPLNLVDSFTNVDDPTFTCSWTQDSGPSGTLGNSTNCSTATFTPNGFGSAHLTGSITDTSMNTSNTAVPIGGYLVNANGNIDVLTESGSAAITSWIGDIIPTAENPWGWKANRDLFEGDLWADRLNTLFPDFWNGSAGTGTVAVVGNGTTLTFTGVNPQTVFCGGGTTPVSATSMISVRYSSPQISGQTGHGIYQVALCPTSSTIVISAGGDGWWQTATTSGLAYNVGAYDDYAQWVYSLIPGNYYDNVLAFYSLYYATGIDEYRDAARTLAQRWIESPNWDLGYNYALVGGNYHGVVGPARGQAVTGLMIWAEEDPGIGYDPWDGIHGLWDYWTYAANAIVTQGSIGDMRELGYITAGLASCAQYDPDMTWRGDCDTALDGLIDDTYIALETTAPGSGGHWVWPIVNRAAFAGGSISVHVQDGSTTATLQGYTSITTTLNGTITSGDTSITLTSVVGMAVNRPFIIGTESINCTVLTNSTFSSCTRGYNSTTPAGHTTGATVTRWDWYAPNFQDCYGISPSAFDCWLWFTDDPTNYLLPGNSTAALGDTTAYLVSAVTGSTTLTLGTTYNSGTCPSGCDRGLMVASYAGLGTLYYMEAMAMGALGQAHQYYTSIADTSRANSIKLMIADGMADVATAGYDSAAHDLYGSGYFIHCDTVTAANQPCPGDRSLSGEAMRGFSEDYRLNRSPATLASGNELYHYVWGKPGYDAPYVTSGSTYLDALNDDGYMNVNSAPSNKWFGFFFGIGYGQSWPAARSGSQTYSPVVTGQMTCIGNCIFR